MRNNAAFFIFGTVVGMLISKKAKKTAILAEKRKTKYWKREFNKNRKALEDLNDRMRYLTLDEAENLFEELDIPETSPFLGVISPLVDDLPLYYR